MTETPSNYPAKLRGAGDWFVSWALSPTNLLIVASLIIGLLAGSLAILAGGFDPVVAFSALIQGAFGSSQSVLRTIDKAVPLVFTGLAALIAFKGGAFNLGVEGQMIVGALAGAIAGAYITGIPGPIHLVLVFLVTILAGGSFALVPAMLKVRFGVNEIISTIMLNYVAVWGTSYLVNGPFKAPGYVPQTLPVAPAINLNRVFILPGVNFSLLVAILCVGLTLFLMKRTRFGYELNAVGINRTAAGVAGISVNRTTYLVFFISGALGGIAGILQVLVAHGRYIQGFSPGYGFDGVAVALVGQLNPVGVAFGALLFGALRSGGMQLDRVTDIPVDFSIFLQGVVILVIATPGIISFLFRRRRATR